VCVWDKNIELASIWKLKKTKQCRYTLT
jgi:hypothetical protein